MVDDPGSVPTAAPVGPAPAPSTPPPAPAAAPTDDANQNKIWAILAYFSFVSLIVLFAKKDSAFAHYHAKQGTVLFILQVIVWFVMAILTGTLVFMSGLFFIVPLISMVLSLGLFVLFIIGLINAANGQQKPLPLVGHFADQIKL